MIGEESHGSIQNPVAAESRECDGSPKDHEHNDSFEEEPDQGQSKAGLAEGQDQTRLPTPPSEPTRPNLKRKQPSNLEEILPPGRALKRGQSDLVQPEQPYGDDVNWGEYFDAWPHPSERPPDNMADARVVKRSRASSTSSLSQSVRDNVPAVAWSLDHVGDMHKAGLVMAITDTQPPIATESIKLCEKLLTTEYVLPNWLFFDDALFSKVLHGAQNRNETRVVRDVTQMIVPSAEILTYVDLIPPGILDVLDAEWTRCAPICGPRPKPDFTAGISEFAFTDEEHEKLQRTHTVTTPNLFVQRTYFPFLVCEVKCSDRSLDEAERQAMHSACVATRAIVQLFRQVGSQSEVDGEILVFSVVHNHFTVRLHGHYVKIEGEKMTHYRKRLYACDFGAEVKEGGQWTRMWQITRAIYEHFFPLHLQRIKKALALIPSLEIPTTPLLVPGDDGQQDSATVASSAGDDVFKRPSRSANAALQRTNEQLREQLSEMMQENVKRGEFMERLLEQQREESAKQLAEHKEQAHEQKESLERLLAQQKVDAEKQLAEQKEQAKRQLTEQKEQAREQKESLERLLIQQKEQAREQRALFEQQMKQQEASHQELIRLLTKTRD